MVKRLTQKCFVGSVLAALHPMAHNPQLMNQYRQFENELNLQGIEIPMRLFQVPKCESKMKSQSMFLVMRKVFILYIYPPSDFQDISIYCSSLMVNKIIIALSEISAVF